MVLRLFQRLFSGKSSGFNKDNSDKILRCPRCRIKMRKLTRENVTIDVCPNCNGLWLDDGELDALSEVASRGIAAAVSSHLEKTSVKNKSSKRKDGKEIKTTKNTKPVRTTKTVKTSQNSHSKSSGSRKGSKRR